MNNNNEIANKSALKGQYNSAQGNTLGNGAIIVFMLYDVTLKVSNINNPGF
jgi:hypothetical protein